MKKLYLICIIVITFAIAPFCQQSNAKNYQLNSENAKSIYSYSAKDIDGNVVNFSTFKGKVLVIVNTASKCGLVEQLGELEQLHQKYKDKGVVVLGFPSNDFLSQEPLANDEIKSFCSKNYGVTFLMFEKIAVKGDNIAPIYSFLTEKSKNGVVDAPIKWNYQKFLIDKNGFVNCVISPRTSVNDEEFMQALGDVLK